MGGEPLTEENITDVYILLSNIRKLYGDTKKIWLYTGLKLNIYNFIFISKGISKDCNYHNTLLKTLELCDYVIDGEFIDDLKDRNLRFRGSSNQRIIDVKKTIMKKSLVIIDD